MCDPPCSGSKLPLPQGYFLDSSYA